MGKRNTGLLPVEVGQLQERVEAWRRARKQGAPTPSDLWETATELAVQFGVCRIGRAVGLDYTSLRKRVAKAKGTVAKAHAAFVEFPTGLVLPGIPAEAVPDMSWEQRSGPMIEISKPGGARMRICLEAGKGGDAAGIVAAFMRDGR
jgi:hypothetical protein